MSLVVGETYALGEDFVGESASELTVKRGETVTVEAGEDPGNPGWVYVTGASGSGYVPTSFLVAGNAEYVDASGAVPFANGQSVPTSYVQEGIAPPIPAPVGSNPFDESVNLATEAAPTTAVIGSAGPNWLQRDNDTGEEFLPSVSSRRWYYRDLFNDLQGPFNATEMRQRLDARYITQSTSILIETGSGVTSKFYEDTLGALFASELKAFREPPVVTNAGDELWYFVDADRYEQGPFSSDQMKVWMDQGYFCSRTSIRRADGKGGRMPLFMVFEDPILAFGLSSEEPTRNAAKQPARRLQHQMSGKDLLKSALEKERIPEEAGPAKPPVTNATQAGGVKQPKPPASPPSSQSSGGGVVYGGPYPEYTGIPTPEKGNSYATLLYTFLTRPLHPAAGVVRCYIVRHIDSSHINYNKYVLYLEETKTPLLIANRHHHTISNYYDIRLKNTGKDRGRGLTIANLETSLGGTEFLLHNSVAGHSGKPKDLGFVLYERSRGLTTSSSSPRKFRAAIPAIKSNSTEYTELPHKGKKKPQIMTSLSSLNTNDVIPLLNKPPKWNRKRQAYTLEFKGRAKISSV